MSTTSDGLRAATQVFIDRGLITRDQARQGLARISGAVAREAAACRDDASPDQETRTRAQRKLRGRLAECSASLTAPAQEGREPR